MLYPSTSGFGTRFLPRGCARMTFYLSILKNVKITKMSKLAECHISILLTSLSKRSVPYYIIIELD